MILDPRTRKSVAFLMMEHNGTRSPVGTGFFVAANPKNVYAVTAGHVVDGVGSHRDASLFVRVRLASGSFDDIELPPDAWAMHPTEDVAAITCPEEPHEDRRHLRMWDEFLDQETLERREVDAGAKVFFIGLFAPAIGDDAWHPHLPIARFGTIALGRGDRIRTRFGREIRHLDAYLVELHSWGGVSGSPAFVYFQDLHERSAYMLESDPENLRGFLPGFGRLLGLVSGHFDVRQPVEFTGDPLFTASTQINSGIAVVTPYDHVIEAIRMAASK